MPFSTSFLATTTNKTKIQNNKDAVGHTETSMEELQEQSWIECSFSLLLFSQNLKKFSQPVILLHACVYIYSRHLSSFRAPALWFIDLNIDLNIDLYLLCSIHFSEFVSFYFYFFFTRKQTIKSAIFVWCAQSINTEKDESSPVPTPSSISLSPCGRRWSDFERKWNHWSVCIACFLFYSHATKYTTIKHLHLAKKIKDFI